MVRRRRNRKIVLFVLLVLLVTGCKVSVPKGVIQPDEMEPLLYDYHLAQAMGQSVPPDEQYKREEYFRYVFAKHHTTRAIFDSSMVWYMRNPKSLSVIYANLTKRLKEENDIYTGVLEQQEGKSNATLSGDTVNVWYMSPVQWLMDVPLSNKVSFVIQPDTTYYQRDVFEWNVEFAFLRGAPSGVSSKTGSGGEAYITLMARYDNDSVFSRGLSVTDNGPYTLRLQCDSTYTLKEVRGYVYYHEFSDNHPVTTLLLKNISLMRYHRGRPVEVTAPVLDTNIQ